LSARSGKCTGRRCAIATPVELPSSAAPRDAPHPVAFDQVDGSIVRIEQALAGFEDRFEDRCRVRDRTADDPQYVCGRGLLLQRLFQIARLGLNLVEQARILNRNYRLVGEGAQQAAFSIPERLHGSTTYPQHRCDCHRIVLAEPVGSLAQNGRYVGVVEDVRMSYQPTLANRDLARTSLKRHRKQRADAFSIGAMHRADMQQAIFAHQKDEALVSAK
jgi:hypothetical protein